MELCDTVTLFRQAGYEDGGALWDVFLLCGVRLVRERRAGVGDRAVMYLFPGKTGCLSGSSPAPVPEIAPGDMVMAGDRREDDPAAHGDAMRVTGAEVFSFGSDGVRHVKVTLR